MKPRVLVVDDEESIRFTFRTFLEEAAYEVLTADGLQAGFALVEEERFDLAFVDIVLGRDSGLEMLRRIKEICPVCPVVMITGAPEIPTAAEAVRLGAFDYVPKPIRQESLLRIGKVAYQHKQALEEREKYRMRLEAIFRSVREGIITVSPEGRITEINQAACRIFGCEPDIVGEGLEAIPGEPGKECRRLAEQAISTTRPSELYRITAGAAREAKYLSMTAAPLAGPCGTVDGAVLLVRDETHLAQLERGRRERRGFDRLIGRSNGIQKVYDLIENLAQVDTTVLLTGESGTGKELAAEALHFRGPRRQGPLVRINCAALPETLLESELFGHVRGAFTGAVRDRQGQFEQAHGGTLFLDEIGDISPALQVRLLRVLQEKEVQKVGGGEPVKVDVRVIAATNRDLRDQVRKGEFREDLFYRLQVVEIRMPALRDRQEDIPLLAEHFLRQFNARLHRQIVGFSPEALQSLIVYRWPGNIRELENTIERAAILCRTSCITPADLPERMAALDVSLPAAVSGEMEAELIRRALEKADWNKSRAAGLLGISRRTIYRKIEEYGIRAPGP